MFGEASWFATDFKYFEDVLGVALNGASGTLVVSMRLKQVLEDGLDVVTAECKTVRKVWPKPAHYVDWEIIWQPFVSRLEWV